MKKTIITHFYNEEYLLPWWLNHHKKYFDHGILINYGSTDRSVEIIKEICPNWEIRNSVHSEFDTELCDKEIQDIEKNIVGWRIALTVSEFLSGNVELLFKDTVERMQYFIGTVLFADYKPDESFTHNKPLWEQTHRGCYYLSRSLHNFSDITYPLGRYYSNTSISTQTAGVFNFECAYVGKNMIDRRNTIFSKFSQRNKDIKAGIPSLHVMDHELENWLTHSLYPVCTDVSLTINGLTNKKLLNNAIKIEQIKDYTIYVYSNKPHTYGPMKESIKPEILNYFDGSNAHSFSRLVNRCIQQCPTETMILMCDKVMPKPHQVHAILSALELGYAFASVYRFGFYGFKKELFRRIGMFDENFIPGGHEDMDFFIRLKEANLGIYMIHDVEYSTGPSSFNYNESRKYWFKKWNEHGGDTILERILDEEPNKYDLGPSVPTKFLDYSHSYIQYSHLNHDLIRLLNKKLILPRKQILAEI